MAWANSRKRPRRIASTAVSTEAYAVTMTTAVPWRDTQDLLKHIQSALLAELKVEKNNVIAARFQLLDCQRARLPTAMAS